MNIQWDSQNYTKQFSFVHQYGEDVLKLLGCPPGSRVIDLGCGNGALSEKLAQMGYQVLGIDDSEEMIQTARSLHPELDFRVDNALTFSLSQKADAIFSNAVFHWIDGHDQKRLAANLARQIKPGGILVCEFGGKGCGEAVHSTLEKSFARRGLVYPRTFYFPTIGEYAPLLEEQGFRVECALLFDRPTVQKTEQGLENWIRMFVKEPFAGISDEVKEEIIRETVEALRGRLYQDGKWFVDYVRIRIKASLQRE